MIPWEKAHPLQVADARPVKALVMGNMIYLEELPQGTVHVAAAASRQSLAACLQALLRHLSPLQETTATSGIPARYAVASTTPTEDGKAVLHIPGVNSLSDLAYIGFQEPGKPLLWRRVSE